MSKRSSATQQRVDPIKWGVILSLFVVLFANRDKIDIRHQSSMSPSLSQPVHVSDEVYDDTATTEQTRDYTADENRVREIVGGNVANVGIVKEPKRYRVTVRYHEMIYESENLYDAISMAIKDHQKE